MCRASFDQYRNFESAAAASVTSSSLLPGVEPGGVSSAVIAREGGRSSIPEAARFDQEGRGVLDPRFRGDDELSCVEVVHNL
jgi:hypothetical protein